MFHLCHLPPASALAHAVRHIWQVERSNIGFQYEVMIPKGVIEIVFNFSEAADFRAQIGAFSSTLPRCFINGYNSLPVELLLPERQVFFGVVLHPAAVKSLFGVPAGELSNQCVDMTLIDTSLSSLWHQLAEAAAFEERVAVFTAWLQQRVPDLSPQDRLLNRFLTPGAEPVRTVPELAELVCYSQRHLSRKLKDLTGMNAEVALLYQKYLQAVDLMHHSALTLTEIAHACHFSDQAHFSKTFKQFAQRSPRAYRQAKSHLPGHLYHNGR